MADSKRVEELIRQTTTADEDLVFQKEMVQSNRINWKVFESTYLTPEQYQLMSSYDKSDRDSRLRLFEESSSVYASLFLHLLGSLQQPEHLKCLLVLIEEIFEDFPMESKTQRIHSFLQLAHENKELPLGPFLALLDMQDQYLQYLAAQLAGTLLFHAPEKHDDEDKDADALLRWIVSTLKKGGGTHSRRAAIKCLQNVLQKDSLRVKFSEMGGMSVLETILKDQHKAVMEAKSAQQEEVELSGGAASAASSQRDLQLVYETLFCCWVLSYNAVIAQSDFTGTSIILNTVRLMREVDKEKIRRVGLALLRNLSGKAEHDEAMIHAGFYKVVVQLSVKRFGDADIVADIEVLLERMETKLFEMTSYDRYKQECLTGQLEWSPPHKSERFWKENFSRFNERDFEVVGILAALLKSEDLQTKCIAAHDLGEFARFHPMGKKIIQERGIKTSIMTLIDSAEMSVQQAALLALQKIMISNYSFVAAK